MTTVQEFANRAALFAEQKRTLEAGVPITMQLEEATRAEIQALKDSLGEVEVALDPAKAKKVHAQIAAANAKLEMLRDSLTGTTTAISKVDTQRRNAEVAMHSLRGVEFGQQALAKARDLDRVLLPDLASTLQDLVAAGNQCAAAFGQAGNRDAALDVRTNIAMSMAALLQSVGIDVQPGDSIRAGRDHSKLGALTLQDALAEFEANISMVRFD